MDLDDIVKAIVPKSQRKSLKKRLKKDGIWGLILAIFKPLWRVFSDRTNLHQSISPSRQAHTPPKKRKEPILEELDQAHTYRQKILMMTEKSEKDSLERMQLELLSERVTEWVEKLEVIVTRMIAQAEDPLLKTERKRVPKAIKRLENQLHVTNDPELQQKLNRTLQNRRKQLEHLDRLANQRQMALLKVENTVAQLSIIYSQLQSGQYLKKRSRFERLTLEISDEVEGLNDYLTTLNDLQKKTS